MDDLDIQLDGAHTRPVHKPLALIITLFHVVGELGEGRHGDAVIRTIQVTLQVVA
jgi:hypothetical protein